MEDAICDLQFSISAPIIYYSRSYTTKLKSILFPKKVVFLFFMKNIFTIILLIVWTSLTVDAQENISAADSLNVLAVEFRQSDMQTSLSIAEAAYKVSEKQSDTLTMAESLINIGLAQYYLSQYDIAIASFKKSYRFYKLLNNAAGMSAAANNTGMVYYQLSNFKQAEKYYTVSLNIDRSLKDTSGMAYGLNNLGQIFQINGDYPKAIEYYRLSGDFERTTGNAFGEAQTWINIGSAYSEAGNKLKGNEFYQKALGYFTLVNDSQHLSMVLSNLGDNYRISSDFAQARKFIVKAIDLSKQNKNDIELINAQIFYSKLLSDENKPDSAEFYLFEALNRCVETDNNLLACDALMQQGFILSKNKKYEEANQYLLNAYEFAADMNYLSGLRTILQQLSENYSALGEFEEALKYQKMAASVGLPAQISSKAINENSATELKQSAGKTLFTGLLLGFFMILILTIVYLYTRMKYYKKLAESHSTAGEERK